jgi:hypothetical protein
MNGNERWQMYGLQQIERVNAKRMVRAVPRRDNWGGCIFIYSCSARRISFESDCFYVYGM